MTVYTSIGLGFIDAENYNRDNEIHLPYIKGTTLVIISSYVYLIVIVVIEEALHKLFRFVFHVFNYSLFPILYKDCWSINLGIRELNSKFAYKPCSTSYKSVLSLSLFAPFLFERQCVRKLIQSAINISHTFMRIICRRFGRGGQQIDEAHVQMLNLNNTECHFGISENKQIFYEYWDVES